MTDNMSIDNKKNWKAGDLILLKGEPIWLILEVCVENMVAWNLVRKRKEAIIKFDPGDQRWEVIAGDDSESSCPT